MLKRRDSPYLAGRRAGLWYKWKRDPLIADCVLMLLDEPFAGIDPISISDIRDLVRELKKRDIGVLITDHNVRETLDIVDRACIIYDGQVLFEGTPQALVADENVRRLYLGESFAL